MDPERFSRVQAVFSRIRRLTKEARAAALEAACDGDDALRDEVASLLQYEETDQADPRSDRLDMPALAERARKAAQQMQLFATGADRVAREIKDADLENLTPMQALDLLRKLKGEL